MKNQKKSRLDKTESAMRLFGRKDKEKLFINSTDLSRLFKKGKESIISTIAKMIVKNKVFSLHNADNELVYACRIPEVLTYTSWELISVIPEKTFDEIGSWLSNKLLKKEKIVFDLEELEKFKEELELPSLFIHYFINCYVDCGLIKVNEKKQITFNSKNDNQLNAKMLKNVAYSKKLMEHAQKEDDAMSPEMDSMDILKKLHAEHEIKTAISTISINAKDDFSINHICEIRIGHQDVDLKELESQIIYLESLKTDELPDLIVLSGLIQGTFQHVQKNRRNTLVGGLKGDGQQLHIAHNLMKRISSIGVRVVLNKTDDDKVWAENTSVFMMKALEKNYSPDNSKKSVHFMEIDRMKGSKVWDMVYDFVWRVALEYQIRMGRRLYSAEEVSNKTNGIIQLEESIILLLAYNSLINGEPLDDNFYKIIDVDKIPVPGKIFDDFIMIDDCVFDVAIEDSKTKKIRNISILEKHYFRLSPNSMVGDPTVAIRAITAQLNSMGKKKPDVVFIEHEQQSFLFFTDHTLVVSLPAMQTYNINRRGQNSSISSDPSHRILTTRKEISVAGSTPFMFYKDGSFEVFFNNRHYMDKASISSERIAIPWCVDWQTGSVTASSDLQAKFMDYIMYQLLPYYPTWLFYGGDHVQGFNYPQHPIENQSMGLVGIDTQKQFVKVLIQNALLDVPKDILIKNLKHVGIIPGNHEWNPGNKFGLVHCDMIENAFREKFIHSGIYVPSVLGESVEPRIQIYESASDRMGNHYKVPAGHEVIGGYGFRFQHLLVERGTKGGVGTPVTALKSQLVGNSESFIGVDFLATGHWHSPQMLKLGNTTAFISGSLASTSGYEYLRALHATIGACVLFVGGNKPPSIKFLNTESLLSYEPQGFYSKKNLSSMGFNDDIGFDPFQHRFNLLDGKPQSGLQKFLWKTVEQINHSRDSIFGLK